MLSDWQKWKKKSAKKKSNFKSISKILARWFVRPVHFGRLQRAVAPIGRIPLRIGPAVEPFGGCAGGCGFLQVLDVVDEPFGGRGGGCGFMEANGFVVDVSL